MLKHLPGTKYTVELHSCTVYYFSHTLAAPCNVCGPCNWGCCRSLNTDCIYFESDNMSHMMNSKEKNTKK